MSVLDEACIVQNNSHETGLFLRAPLSSWPWCFIPWPYSIEPLQGPAVRISFIITQEEPNPMNQLTGSKSPRPSKPNQLRSGLSLPAPLLLPTRTVRSETFQNYVSSLPDNAIKHSEAIAWNNEATFKWQFS